MPIGKLPRLAVNWFSQPELFRRYWDQVMNSIEDLRNSYELLFLSVENINATPVVVADLTGAPDSPRAIVSDATTKIFGDAVVGGGVENVPVYFDGTIWRIG